MDKQPARPINLRLPLGLLAEIDAAAASSGLDRSNWIRQAVMAALRHSGGSAPLSPSRDQALVDSVRVVDEGARRVVKDALARIEALEADVRALKGTKDPFG